MVLGIWLPLAILIAAVSGIVGNAYRTEFSGTDSESRRAEQLLATVNPSEGGFTAQVMVKSASLDDPSIKTAIDTTVAGLSKLGGVKVQSPFDFPNQVNKDRTIGFIQLSVEKVQRTELSALGDKARTASAALVATGAQVEFGGEMFAVMSMPESEALGLLAAVIILVLAFGSVIAMGLPIGIALIGLLMASGFVALVSNIMTMPNESTSMVAMIGLGVGIDYALFIVTRFREALHDGLSVEESVIEAIDTSGRAVVFAGITVIVALLGLISVGLSFVTGFAVAMAIGVAVMIVAAVSLLPALLAMLGGRIDNTSYAAVSSLSVIVIGAIGGIFTHTAGVFLAGLVIGVAVMVMRPFVPVLKKPLPHRAQNNHQHTIWWRWSRVIQHHPWRSLVSAFVLLGTLAVPMFSLRLGFSDFGNAEKGTDVRKAYDLISEGFGPGFNGPLYIAVSGETAGDKAKLAAFAGTIGTTDGVAAAVPVPMGSDKVALVIAYPATSPQDEKTTDLVHDLREKVIPASGTTAYVGGFTASGIDFSEYLGRRLPYLIGIVLVLSFVLLMAVFRSILVPLKAVFMNLLSVGASYGVIVAVFQWGWMSGLLGVGKPGPVEAWAPMFLFAIVFGLSMDYEVFLLSRMKEEYDRTGDNFTAVADGVAATARVITAAALIMVCVFAAFVLAPDRQLKLFGMGMAVAVFVDATVVRMILVPATMELLGARNWWMPKWLDKVLPKIEVEGSHHDHVIS